MRKRRPQTHQTSPQPIPPPSPVPTSAGVLTVGLWMATALAFCAPFIGASGPALFFEPLFDTTLRRLVLFGSGGLLVALMVLSWARRRRLCWRPHLLDLLVGLFLLGLLVSAVRSPYPHLAFFGPLWSQIALPFVGIGILLYIGVKYFARTPADVERVAIALVLAGGIVALLGLVDRFSDDGYAAAFSPPRLTGILRNPMFTGLYLTMLVPLGIGVSLATERRWLRLVTLVTVGVMILALVLTLARSAWLGFAASLLLLGPAIIWRYRGRLSRTTRIGVPVALGMLVLLALLTPAVRSRLQSMTDLRGATVQSRLVYMQSAWGMFRARPLTGWGVGTFTLIAPEFRPATNIEEGGISINRVAALALPHNLPLQLAAETGLLGLVPFLLLILIALGAGITLRNASVQQWGLTWGLVGMISAYIVTILFAFDISITLANAWIGFGLLAAVTARKRTAFSVPAFGKPVAIMLYCLAGVIGFGTLLWVFGDGAAANDTLLGTRQSFRKARAMQHDPARCLQTSEAGIQRLEGILHTALVPCFVSYRYVAMAYREQMLLLRENNPEAAREAQTKMLHYGRQALAKMDRDPEMLLFLTIEYLDYEHAPEMRQRVEEVRPLLKQLLTFLPNSAQAHLLQAKLLAYDRKIDAAEAAAQHALSLDPKYARAHLWLARIQCIKLDRILLGQEPDRQAVDLVTGADAAGRQLAQDTLTHFTRAQELGLVFDDSDRMKYATTLFLLGQTDRGIAEGRQLTDTRQVHILCDRVNYFYTVTGQHDIGQKIITLLQQPLPPAETIQQETSSSSPVPPQTPAPAFQAPWHFTPEP